MIDKRLLKAKMYEYGDRYEELTDALGLSRSRLSAKCNEYRGAQFTMNEMGIIKKRYNLSPDEFDAIFYPETI